MTKKIEVKYPTTGDSVTIEVEDHHKVRDVITLVVDHLKLQPAPYWLQKGKKQIPPDGTIGSANIMDGDVVELIPDPTGGTKYPEGSWKRRLKSEYRMLSSEHNGFFDFDVDNETMPMQYVVHYRGIPSYSKPGTGSKPIIKNEHDVEITLDRNYPYKPPVVRMLSHIFHPNVRVSDNIICIDMINKHWRETFTITEVVKNIETFLWKPNPDSPYNNEAAEWVRKHPLPEPKDSEEWGRKPVIYTEGRGEGPRIVG